MKHRRRRDCTPRPLTVVILACRARLYCSLKRSTMSLAFVDAESMAVTRCGTAGLGVGLGGCEWGATLRSVHRRVCECR